MHFITDSNSFNNICRSICDSHHSYIAIDTEFVRERTYWPKWALLQIATQDDIYLVDISSFNKKDDFDFFKNLLLQNNILKVFHACRQDIEIFFHDLNIIPNGIFDCQIAAVLCGYEEGMGMSSMASEFLGLKIVKTQQYTNWLARPLSQKQIDYAIDDVKIIRSLYEILKEKIEKLERWGWLHYEQEYLLDANTYVPDHQKLWKKLKTHHKLKATKRALLQDFCQWREEKARELDYNRRRVLSDELLIKLLEIKNMDSISLADRLPDIPIDYVEEITQVFEKFKKRSPQSYPQLDYPPSRPKYLNVAFGGLSQLRQQASLKYGISERLIASVEEMKDFISGKDVNFLKNWRYEVFGKDAEAILTQYKTST